MADVNLSVGVTGSGIERAIQQINELRASGQTSQKAMNELGAAIDTAMRNGGRAIAVAATTMKEFNRGTAATAKESLALEQGLKAQAQAYREIALAAPKASAAQRLAMFGNGSLAAGMTNAAILEQGRAAFNADPVRDANAVTAENNRLLDARSQKLSALANVERATWEQGLQGMTAAQRAAAQLARAQENLVAANKAVNQSFIQQRSAGGQFLPFTSAQIQGQNRALNEQAAAIRQVTSAEMTLTGAHDAASKSAFASSFSYFIIAGAAQQLTQALIGAGTATIGTSATLERSFADVNRTFEGTSSQLDGLKQKLFDLSTTTPIAFTDLSQIAALGNQLGIAADDIQSFTTTISQYSAISGQSAEDSATAFGKISNLTGLAASQYSNLASSIEYVARTSVATEATISRTATEITALASGAGFSAQGIVGLAGALSSLSIPPERARGALSLYFGALNNAVASGGPKLEAFAQLTGKTADEIGRLVRENKGQEVFTSFIAGLSQLNTVAKTTALGTLGLSTIRVDQTMRALSQNVPLLTSSLQGADESFKSNTELARQYAIIQDTLASKITEFQNAIQNAVAAMGDRFAPALSDLLSFTTELIVNFSQFASTPFGSTLLQLAGAVAILVTALASVIGTLALARAGLVVFKFAMDGLEWTSASAGFRGLIASLLSTERATRSAAWSMTALKAAMAETNFAAGALRVGLIALRVATGLIVLSVVIAAISALGHAMNYAQDSVDGLGGSVDELRTAMQTDNPELFGKTIKKAGEAATDASGGVIDLNSAVLAAVKAQQDASGAVDGTNKKIDEQSIKLGDATQAWLKSAVLQSDAMKKILDTNGDFWTFLNGDPQKNGPEAISLALQKGFDLDKFAKTVYTKGGEAGTKMYDGFVAGLIKKGDKGTALKLATFDLRGKFILPLATGVETAKTQAIIAKALDGTGATATDTSKAVDSLGNTMSATGQAAVATGDGFYGAVSGLTAYQDAVQSGISKFSDFGTILKQVQAAQDEANKRTKGPSGTDTSLINATAFKKDLDAANDSAVTFFNGLETLAQGGRSSFATQLAGLGPDAQGILSSALNLSPEAQGQLEASARFAAFLASDEFKATLSTSMSNANLAYAKIFQTTGNLSDVQSYIAAQVAGTAAQWEKEWDAHHPTATLNVDFANPSDDEINAMQAQISGRLTVTATVIPVVDPSTDSIKIGAPGMKGNQYTDTKTGNTITLPAKLDGQALTASLSAWMADENATPEEIEATLNTAGLSPYLDAWLAEHGRIQLQATVKITPPPATLPGFYKVPGGVQANQAKGGEIPHFASGGTWGQFRGPGTGTSDSILARVSAGEYISTNQATRFWGPDFFDSLNRKMLPTSFLNMLGAVARSGSNSGPSHVAHVQVVQNNPLTRDPLKQLREDSEMVSNGIWG